MLKVVIIGYGEMFTNIIAGTLDANCEIAGVYRLESKKYHPFIRKMKDIINPSTDYNYIKSYNLHEIYTNYSKKENRGVNTTSFKKQLLKLNPDIILVCSWCEIINKEIYDIPKIATINVHPSLLPKYRGPNPYFWVIRNQEQVSGVTFHLLTDKLDSGAILAQEEIKIYPSDTGKSLKARTVLTARGVVCELLSALREDIIIPLTQNENKATYFSHPSDLALDFSKSAEENDALIRAINPWGEAYFYHKNNILAVKHSEIHQNDTQYNEYGTITDCKPTDKTISVLCGNNKILKMFIENYKKYDRPFTKNYIKKELFVGENLCNWELL